MGIIALMRGATAVANQLVQPRLEALVITNFSIGLLHAFLVNSVSAVIA